MLWAYSYFYDGVWLMAEYEYTFSVKAEAQVTASVIAESYEEAVELIKQGDPYSYYEEIHDVDFDDVELVGTKKL